MDVTYFRTENQEYSLPTSFMYHTTEELKVLRDWLQDNLNMYFYEHGEEGVKKQKTDDAVILNQGFLFYLEWFNDELNNCPDECHASFGKPLEEEEEMFRRAESLMWENEDVWQLEDSEGFGE